MFDFSPNDEPTSLDEVSSYASTVLSPEVERFSRDEQAFRSAFCEAFVQQFSNQQLEARFNQRITQGLSEVDLVQAFLDGASIVSDLIVFDYLKHLHHHGFFHTTDCSTPLSLASIEMRESLTLDQFKREVMSSIQNDNGKLSENIEHDSFDNYLEMLSGARSHVRGDEAVHISIRLLNHNESIDLAMRTLLAELEEYSEKHQITYLIYAPEPEKIVPSGLEDVIRC